MMKFFRRNKENRGNAASQSGNAGPVSRTAKPDARVNLTVICPALGSEGDDILTVPISPDKTVHDLKLQIQDACGVPYEFLQILQDPQGQPMNDDDVLGFEEGHVVYLRLDEMEAASFPLGDEAWAHGNQCAEELVEDLQDDAEQE